MRCHNDRAQTLLIRSRQAGALAVLGLWLVAGAAAPTARAAGYAAILTEEHLHLSPDYDGGWNLHLYDFDNGADYDPATTLIYVDPISRTTQPAGVTWEFIGAGASQPDFRTPQSPAAGLVSFSVATEETLPTAFTPYVETDPRVPATSSRWMKFQLTELRGPGQFALWQQSGANLSNVWISTADGLGSTDYAILPAGGHIHYYAGFTQPGYYELDFVGSGKIGAATSTSPVETYHVVVAPPTGVASLGAGQALTIDSTGAASVLADRADGLFTPIDLEYGPEAQLYAADVLTSRVWRFDLAGQPTLLADASDGLTSPAGLAVAANGDVFVSNYLTDSIMRITPAGVVSTFADAADGLDGPFGLALDQAGNLFAADLGNNRVLKFSAAGVPSVFADAADGLLTPLSVAVDATGNVFVSDVLKSQIRKFTPAGAGSLFADAGDGLVTPSGLGFDLKGNLSVADYLGNKLWQFTPLGVPTLLADAADGLAEPFGVATYNPRLLPLGSGATNVPEPASAGLLGLGLVLLGASRVPWVYGGCKRSRRSGAFPQAFWGCSVRSLGGRLRFHESCASHAYQARARK